ncbi:MAG: sensor histidine kinase [Planctomycetota bacterium]|jgi:two-component system phosphate regulon sensor histidine kinase PhoR
MTGFWKVFCATALVVAIAVAVVGALAVDVLTERADAQLERGVMSETALLAAALRTTLGDGDPDAVLQAEVDALAARAPGRRITVVGLDGRVLADSAENPAVMDNHGEREEILAAGGNEPPLLRYSRTLQQEMLYYALPVRVGGDGAVLGFARLAVPAVDIRAQQAELRSAIMRGALIALLVGALLAAWLARSVQRPIQRISEFVGRIARGEQAAPLPAHGHGDLDDLAHAVNHMAKELDERFDRIARDQSEIRAILGSMAEGVIAVDAEQRVMVMNAMAAEMLEVSGEDARGKLLWEVTRITEVTGIVATCLGTNRAGVDEALLAREGGDRVLALTASPLGDGTTTWGCVLVLHDLSEMRRLETVRRDFVVNVSHELKTPLTAMRGFLEAVLEDPDLDPGKTQRFLTRAQDNTDRMVAIVGDLLSLARIEAADSALRMTRLDLRDIATECHAEAAGNAAMRNVQLQLDLPGEEIAVLGDRTALATALNNLLDNAVNYSPTGQRVRLYVGADHGEAWVAVTDQGPGIPPNETERIFERFYRTDKNRSRELGGTGLGLSIVKNVVTSHGGRVELDTALGRGSTFTIRLPLQSPLAATVPSGSGVTKAEPPEDA